MLGSSYGSTNAASIDPSTGKRYGPRFPDITVSDIVATQRALLDHLGIERLVAIVGPSYGGFQALSMGGRLSRHDEGDCGHRHLSDGAARARRRQCASGCSRPCRRIRTGTAATITIAAACWRAMIQIRISHAQDLWHRDPAAGHHVRSRTDRGGDPRRGHAMGEGLRCEFADHPGEGVARLRRDGAIFGRSNRRCCTCCREPTGCFRRNSLRA